jgi:hypothetical protein
MKLRSLLLPVLAVLALALGTAAQAAPPPSVEKGMVQINYHRADGAYEKWGVHLWKSPNMPLEGIEWPNPMMPSGKSDYGVYWVAKLDEFKTGTRARVNYIIHKGDIKEQGGKDMQFNGMETQVIYVNAYDSKIYTSLEEAMKAPSFTATK